jgi:hypothetical protein
MIGTLRKVLFILILLSRRLQYKYDKTREVEETVFDMNIICRHKNSG